MVHPLQILRQPPLHFGESRFKHLLFFQGWRQGKKPETFSIPVKGLGLSVRRGDNPLRPDAVGHF